MSKIKPRSSRRPKGLASVSTDRGRLRISLPRTLFQGKQKFISLGVIDSPENRIEAEAKALEISRDIKLGRFDFSLGKYRPGQVRSNSENSREVFTLSELYGKYIEAKRATVRPGTWRTYTSNLRKLKSAPFSDADIKDIVVSDIYSWALSSMKSGSGYRLIVELNACFEWAIVQKIIDVPRSPFEESLAFFRKNAQKKGKNTINPFSAEERDLIISAFEGNHYYNYVRFCFFTGCRSSEAIALQWSDISADFSYISFSRAALQGENGLELCDGLKTQKSRIFPCNRQVKAILQDIKSQDLMSNYVFSSPQGKMMLQRNFFKRAWQPILKELPILYRKPYNMRHTFISLCLDQGLDAKDISQLVGNSAATIYKHYAGGKLKEVPEL